MMEQPFYLRKSHVSLRNQLPLQVCWGEKNPLQVISCQEGIKCKPTLSFK